MVNIMLRFLFAAFTSIIMGLLFMGIGRKFIARIRRHYAGPFYQSFIDVIKLFSKKSISHNWIMDFGVMMGFAGIIATIIFMPIGPFNVFSQMQGNIIIIIYFMTIGYLGMAMGVAASGNPNATIGIARALTLMLGYEIPFVLTVILLVFANNSSLLQVMVVNQQGGFMEWNAIRYPFAFLAALIALQGMLGEQPFDAMIAPSEIASGPMVELSGKFLGFGFLQHAAQIFLETGIIVNMFLGGSQNFFIFFAKQLALYLLTVAVSGIFPRYRFEDAVKFFWMAPTALAAIQLIIFII
ncbi:MAG: NADH-quinone oxidoreductase subunit H [bacterium]|nr:NADH-quinone oxidoreductase subunit H [bacterium]